MTDDAGALHLIAEMRELTRTRQYWELERRLLALPRKLLLSEPELGEHLSLAWLHLRKTTEGINYTLELLKETYRQQNTFRCRRLELLASLLFSQAGRLDEGEEAVQRCMLDLDWNQPSKLVAGANNSWGAIRNMKGDWDAAILYMQRALAIYRQIGHRLGIAAVTHNIGLSYRQRGQYEDAENYYLAASVYYSAYGTVEEHAFTQAERSLAVLGLGDIELAEFMARRALESCRRLANRELLCETLRILAIVLRTKGQARDARDLLRESFSYARSCGYIQMKAEVHLELGLVEHDLRNNQTAIRHLLRAQRWFRAMGASEWERRVTEHLRSCGYTAVTQLLASPPDPSLQ
jgi:tetratricopeptide (TPR) repeat protein